MNVRYTRSSGVATITLSADETDRFMASSRTGIVNEIRLALLEAMQVAEPASKRKEPAKRETRISFAKSPQQVDRERRRAERRKALGLDP